ncbi:MAG: hypothetical protein N3E37_01895 [Candidatus Micrarchaeota archaeon]|nr:hypothetical protein [Candidatus Micrarchaeota archaeon]
MLYNTTKKFTMFLFLFFVLNMFVVKLSSASDMFQVLSTQEELSRPDNITLVKVGNNIDEKQISYGNTIFADSIAPGQVLELGIMQRVFTKGKFDIGGTYDKIKVENLPELWTIESISGFNPVYVKIKVPQFAKDGTYNFTIRLIDEEKLDYLDDFVFYVVVDVNKEIISLIANEKYVGNAKEEIEVNFIVENTGNYPETFVVEFFGPKLAKITYSDVFLQPKEKRIFRTVHRFGEAVNYQASIRVVSKNSELVTTKKEITIINRRTITSDLLSTKNGILLFPLNWMHSLITFFAHLIE